MKGCICGAVTLFYNAPGEETPPGCACAAPSAAGPGPVSHSRAWLWFGASDRAK